MTSPELDKLRRIDTLRASIQARHAERKRWDRSTRSREIAGYLLAFVCGAGITYALGSLYLWRIGL